MTGNDSNLGLFILWSRNQRTIVTLIPVRVGIESFLVNVNGGISVRIVLNWNCGDSTHLCSSDSGLNLFYVFHVIRMETDINQI